MSFKTNLIIIFVLFFESTLFAAIQNQSYSTNLKMREERRVGVGFNAGGSLGALGTQIELNIEDADGAVIGFGAGNGFNTFQLLWKHSMAGFFINPYWKGGISHWYKSDQEMKYLSSTISIDEIKNDRSTSAELITGSLGVQYNQLSGQLSGTSFFLELTLLSNIAHRTIIPTGSIGALFYF